MFYRSQRFYDAVYAGKDHAGEAQRLHALIQQHKRSPGRALLDVACGTGGHLVHLRAHYAVEGLDLDPEMLTLARAKLPGVPLHRGDMVDFDLGRRYDVVLCLFSAIGEVKTLDRLGRAVRTMARHLLPGGVLVIEPWLSPEAVEPGRLSALFVDRPDLKLARMNLVEVVGRLSILEFHYLVGTPRGIEHFTERHELGLFTMEEYAQALREDGLEVTVDAEGLTGRGLVIGVRPLEGDVEEATRRADRPEQEFRNAP